jgi:GTPase SAR1 family protein
MEHADPGLGNQALLAKIDKLRELSISLPLPQLIVVGDQSSGKSSVLESLAGFSFPRATGLCTRYATQITCSREDHVRVKVSIIPRQGVDGDHKTKLDKFKREMKRMNNDELARIFEEVCPSTFLSLLLSC